MLSSNHSLRGVYYAMCTFPEDNSIYTILVMRIKNIFVFLNVNYYSQVYTFTRYVRTMWKMCPAAGLCALKSHMIKRNLRSLSF